MSTRTSDADDFGELALSFTYAEKLSGALATALITCTVGEPSTLVRGVLQRETGAGLRTWQELVKWCRPKSASEEATSMIAIIALLHARILAELHRSIMDWELKDADHEAMFGNLCMKVCVPRRPI